jgi:hypothetical protein
MEAQNGWKLLHYLLFGFCLVQGGKKQRTFDDELFQSHATHDLCTYTIQLGQRSMCVCVRVLIQVIRITYQHIYWGYVAFCRITRAIIVKVNSSWYIRYDLNSCIVCLPPSK